MNKTTYTLAFIVLILTTSASAIAPIVNLLSSPKITDAYLSLDKVYIGDDLEIFIAVEDAAGTKEVRGKIQHERGIDFVDFTLQSGNAKNGVWKGTWKVHDTAIDKTYEVTIEAISKNKLRNQAILPFVDPVVSHTPDQIIPQGMGSGLDADKVDALHSADLLAQQSGSGGAGGGGGGVTLWGYISSGTATAGQGSPACPSGFVEAYSGFAWIPQYVPGSTNFQTMGEMHCNSQSGFLSSLPPAATFITGGNPQGGGTFYATHGHFQGTITCRVCVAQAGAGKIGIDTTVLYWTAAQYNGNLGGRSGADTTCTSQLPVSLSGKVTNVKAFISVTASDEIRDLHNGDSDADGTVGPFESNAPIYVFNRDWGKYNQLASDWQDLLDSSISSPISMSTNVLNDRYWTGSDQAAGRVSAAYTCSSWTNNQGAGGYVGLDTEIDGRWMTENVYACQTQHPILCAAKYI